MKFKIRLVPKLVHFDISQEKGKKTQTEYYTYEYDHAGRLLKTKHQLKDDANLKPEVVLAENTYDELGRLKSTTKAGQSKLLSNYAYNVRSWTKSITGTLFSQTLYYNDAYLNNKVQYGGNISGIEWKHDISSKQGYLCYYDNLSRLKSVTSTKDGNVNAAHNAYYEYDKHGNMTLLKRRGLNDNTTYTNLIDDLTLTYTGNKLKNIYDASPNVSLSASQDFKDYSKSKDVKEYFFNANGAMSKDLNKGISDIQYNSLNLPRQMDIKSPVAEARNEYLYSASGVKLQVKTGWNPNFGTTPVVGAAINPASLTESKTTDYAGNKIYEDGVLKRILIDGGYIENNVYHFYLTDHLGNNRVVAKVDGTVVQRSDYYPFGMEFTENREQGVQPYKYNGKELDTKHGLNMYDYSARYYEPSIGRFSTVDALAEKYPSISPYAYVENNPIKYIDPDGREKLNGMGTRGKGDQLVNARKNVDNGMIHIYGHGSPDGMTYVHSDGRTTSIRNASQLQEFLEKNSKTWQSRGKGENMYVILHSCKTGSSEDLLPLAEFISGEMPDVMIGAPSSSLEVTVSGEKVVDTKTDKTGTWDFFKNGEKVWSRTGDTNGNPDMIEYVRPKLAPIQESKQNSPQQKKSYFDRAVDYLKGLFD